MSRVNENEQAAMRQPFRLNSAYVLGSCTVPGHSAAFVFPRSLKYSDAANPRRWTSPYQSTSADQAMVPLRERSWGGASILVCSFCWFPRVKKLQRGSRERPSECNGMFSALVWMAPN